MNVQPKEKQNRYYTNNKYDLAIRVDNENMCIYCYDLVASELDKNINLQSEGILQTIDTKIAKEIQEYLKIDLEDYNVVILNSSIHYKE